MGTVEKRDKHKKRRFVSPEEKLERELKDCMHCRFFWGHNNRCANGTCCKPSKKKEQKLPTECVGCPYYQGKACFGQLDACSVDDVIIIAECGAETAKQWRSEKDRHDYLASIEKQSGMTVFSYNTQTATENEMSGEKLLADNQCDVVEEVLRRFQKAHIQETLATLLPEERDLIESLIISDFPMTEREYAKKVGKTQSTIHCQKAAILKRLKNMLRF
ncbi:hypothetical protein [Agathobacter rectalis]|uniref:hypothetical protein n=2 Tax=Lachnospiraceae TaxID=186803 RepID=UPI0027D2886F|nr:hypothetical protein [Agathobacter rectalis]MCB6952109.1 hypothetical protein [Agathobacter rectalis]